MSPHATVRPRRLRSGTGLVVVVIAMVAVGTLVTGGVAVAQAAAQAGDQSGGPSDAPNADVPGAAGERAAAPRRANGTLRLPGAEGDRGGSETVADPAATGPASPGASMAEDPAAGMTDGSGATAASDASDVAADPTADPTSDPAADPATRLDDAAARRAEAYNARPLGGADRAGPFAGRGGVDTAADGEGHQAGLDALQSGSWLSGSGGELLRVGGALAVVLVLAVLLAKAMRRVNRLATGRRPSGVIEIHARYPIARGQTLVLMQLGRRIVLAHQTGSTMTTLTEVVDPDEVAALLGRIEAGSPDTEAGVFNRLLRDVETGRAPLDTPDDRRANGRHAARPSRRRASAGLDVTAMSAAGERPSSVPVPVPGPGGVELIDLTAAKRRTGLGGRR